MYGLSENFVVPKKFLLCTLESFVYDSCPHPKEESSMDKIKSKYN